MASNKKRDPLPKHFNSIAEVADFWDTHDLTDYWDQTREVDFDVKLERRVFLTALEPELAKLIAIRAQQEGISSETLINVWLKEKVMETAH